MHVLDRATKLNHQGFHLADEKRLKEKLSKSVIPQFNSLRISLGDEIEELRKIQKTSLMQII